jgi:putative transposase
MGTLGVQAVSGIVRAYRYRLYPTSRQEAELREWQSACVRAWNLCLEQRELVRRDPRWRDQVTFRARARKGEGRVQPQWVELAEACEADEHLARPLRACLYYVIDELDRGFQNAYQALRAGVAPSQCPWPRWRSRYRPPALTFGSHPSTHRVRIDGKRGWLWLGKLSPQLGQVKFRAHRPLPEGAKLGEAKVYEDRAGRWYMSLVVRLGNAPPVAADPPTLGINRGLTVFCATSDGELVERPHYWRMYAAELVELDRRIARAQRGSRRRRQLLRQRARLWQAVTARRRQFASELAAHLLDRTSSLAIEQYDVRGMLTDERPELYRTEVSALRRKIADAGWSVFADVLRAKAEERGARIVAVPCRDISRLCAECGERLHDAEVDAAMRWRREVLYHRCGSVQHVDVMAARNVLARALEEVARA